MKIFRFESMAGFVSCVTTKIFDNFSYNCAEHSEN